MEMQEYTYDGPVMIFGVCVENRWQASTYAVSEKKARSNLTYRFKKEHQKLPSAKVELPGKIVAVQRKGNKDGYLHTKFS